jgi:proline dehydrogenase
MEPAPLDFSDTAVAFSHVGDGALRTDYLLFRILSKGKLVKAATPLVKAAMAVGLPVKPLIRATIFRHFCGGEDIAGCEAAVSLLWKRRVGSILDFSVEGKESEESFTSTANEIIRTIHRAAGDEAIPFCVFKPSGIARTGLLEKAGRGETLAAGERSEYEKAAARFERIAGEAAGNNVRLFVDAEETWFQDAVDAIVQRLMMKHNTKSAVVFNTVQLYRTGRLEWMEKAWRHAREHNYKLGLKLVRGAYMEKERKRAAANGYPSPIQPGKAASDSQYDAALAFCIDRIEDISFCNATHNENSSMLLTRLMKEKSIASGDPRIWFSQLLGMSDHISFNLAHAGYNVCKYVPYGPVEAVLPYLIRRAEENSSISGQMSRELMMISRERQRRKLNQA